MSDIVFTETGSSGADFVLRLSANGLNLELVRNGVLVNSPLLASVTSYTINGGNGNESLTIIQPSGGLLALPGGVFFNGGAQSGPPGDAIAIEGGAVASATVTYINATDGSIVLTSGAVTATYTFTGVDPIDTTGSTIDDLVFNLPGNTVTALEDDGTTGNATSQLRDTDASPGFDTTTFSPPNSSLTINGTATDNVTVNPVDGLGAVALIINANLTTFQSLGATAALASLTTDATGTTAINNGSITTTGAQTYNDAVTLGADTTFASTGSGSITFSSTVNAAFDLAVSTAGSASFNGAISGAGDFNQNGSGATTLNAVNAYTGATTINGGTLQVDGSLTASATTVNNGGTLAGSGTVQAVTVNSGGHVAPGSSPESLATGNFTLSAGAFLDVEIGGTTAGTQYDQLIVTGTVTLGGTLTSRLINGFNPANGATFTIIANDGVEPVIGTFAGLSEGAFFAHNGSTYSISYQAGTGDNDVVLTAANDAPVIAVAGTLDAVTANLNTQTVSVMLNNGSGGFNPGTMPVAANGSTPFSIKLGDVDGDGLLDAVTANFNDNTVSLLINNGAGGFNAGTAFTVGGAGPNSVALGDVNGDGLLDAVTANTNSDGVGVLLNNGSGGFSAGSGFTAGGDGPSSVALIDIDLDGRLDAVTANFSSNNVSVVRNDGAGGFSGGFQLAAVGGNGPIFIAVGDVNSDGLPDAVTANFSGNNVSVLINNGTGGLDAGTPYGVGGSPNSVALGDLNGDGNLDIVTANQSTNTISVLINNGDGHFTARTPVAVDGNTPSSVALGDVNGDGHLDAVTANNASDTITLLLNNGTGGFIASVPVAVGGDAPDSVALGPVNNAQVTNEDTAFVFNAVNRNTITLSDVDAGTSDETLTLEVQNGILMLATLAGLTGVTGNGTGTVTFTGTLAEINAALNGLSYTPDDNFNGRDTLRITANDNAGAVAGGPKTAIKLVPIVINAVDDAAVAQNDAVNTAENAVLNGSVFANNGSGVDSDVEGNAFSVTAVNGFGANVGAPIALPSGGTLTLNANGTFTYNPNGVFNALPAAGSGASNTTATVTFTYTLTGGDTAAITITITGVDSDDTLHGTAGANTLTGGIGNDLLLGLAGDDSLNGGSGDDRLYGSTGQNDLAGGLGNDWYIVNSLTDVIIEATSAGTHDRVFTTVNYTLTTGAHVEIVSPTTIFTGAINLTGNDLANTIYGNNNVNVLSGGGGNDVLAGLGGADTLNGGDGNDLLVGGEANDTINGGNGNDRLFGKAGNDTLNGGAGNDRLEGAAGQNDMAGGLGNDTYYVTSATDTVTDAGVQGSLDRVYSSVKFALAAAAQIEFLATSNIAGTTAINLTGNAFANTIYGNNGANIIAGKGANDTLFGRGGADTFVFDTVAHTTANRDIIADFNGVQDTIQLAKSTFTALTGNAGTTLSADQFVIGRHALDANDRIIYSNGALIYDHNGNVAGGEQLIAVLAGRPSLSNADIVLG